MLSNISLIEARKLVRRLSLILLVGIIPFVAISATSEIGVELKLCKENPLVPGEYMPVSDFVIGEKVYGIVDIANSSPDQISVGEVNSQDSFFVEVYRASDHHQLTRTRLRPFVSAFLLKSGEGQKFGTNLDDHYDLLTPSRYLAKPILVHKGIRYEGQSRIFDVVEGVRTGGAMQMFSNRNGLQREFSLVYLSRNHEEHLFLMAKDMGISKRRFETRDLGVILRIDRPTLSILPTGEVVVLHRLNQDQFVRTEFWSLPDTLEFRSRVAVGDPETAGTARVRELYRDKGVKPKSNPWWKFW